MRSDVWLRFGTAIDVERRLDEHPDGDAHALTAEIRRRVESLTLNFESRRESAILTWAADIVATRGESPPALGSEQPSPEEFFRLAGRLQAGYQLLLSRCPDEIAELSKHVRRHHQELRRLGIDAAEVYLPMQAGRAILFVVRELELMVVESAVGPDGRDRLRGPVLRGEVHRPTPLQGQGSMGVERHLSGARCYSPYGRPCC